ncbi:MAG: hypothetical protein COB94_003770 [Gammaproteobacteria bacterium]|nr:hypothetical protein [Gammaproteobacteria bacterium]
MNKRIFIAAMLVCLLTMSVSYAGSQSRYSRYGDNVFIKNGSGEAMVLDALLLRPVGLVTVIIGGAAFVVSLPFSVLGGNVGEAADKLVVEPVNYTFKRKLGDIEF